MKISLIDKVYIAGFFDGEGCIRGMNTERGHPSVVITIGQRDLEVLYWIQETLGMGKVRIRLSNHGHWRITNKKDTKKFINLILPYSKVKKEQLIVGQRLNDLIESNSGHRISEDDRQKRMVLSNQLKMLKRI